MSEKLELTTQATADVEKRLAAHKKNIGVYVGGVHKSGAQLFGYAFLAGREMNLAAEVAPHGKLLPWIKEHFPDLSNGTVGYWRTFAKEIEAKFPTVGNLKPLQLKKSFSAKERKTILEVVPEMMNGQGMVEFMQAAKLQREPKLKGGDTSCRDEAAIRQWCAEYHPDMPAAQCQALPGKLKKEFARWEANQNLNDTPDFDALADSHIHALDVIAGDAATANGCTVAKLKQLEATAAAIKDLFTAALKERKSK